MNTRRVNALAVLVLMLLAFAGARAWTPTKHMADMRPKVDLESLFPKSFGDWTVDTHQPVQVVSPDQAALLSKIYNQTLSRTYVNRLGDRVMLSVAYGGDQSDGTRAHRPEVCYPAQGFQIVSDRTASVQLIDQVVPARQLIARQGRRIEPITYWVVIGDKIALGATQHKVAQLRYSMRGIVPDGMLVRVSTIDSDGERAFAVQERFLRDLSSAVTGDARQRVFGADAE